MTLSAGTVVSLLPGGDSAVIDGSTQAIVTSASAQITVSTEEVLVLGSQTASAGGPAMTAGGTVISVVAGGESIVVGGTTTLPVSGSALSVLLGGSGKVATLTQTQAGTGAKPPLAGVIASLGGFESQVPETLTSTPNPGVETSGYNGPEYTGTSGYNGPMFTGVGVPRDGTSMSCIIAAGLFLCWSFLRWIM